MAQNQVKTPKIKNRYVQLIESIFLKYYQEGADEVAFERADIVKMAKKLRITLPKNLGDVVYSFRYRAELPDIIKSKAKEGFEWIIRPIGRARYSFVLAREANFVPNYQLAKTKIPDGTPGIISKYSLTDEQALLAKIRYNRLIDIFTGVTCYSLQNHLRTTLPDMGQVETDEIYLGIDKQGAHYVFPVQGKGGTDKIGVVQVEQDFAVCKTKFPDAIGCPIAAQFLSKDTIALFEFVETEEGIRVNAERHYKLVPPDELSSEEIAEYQKRATFRC